MLLCGYNATFDKKNFFEKIELLPS